MNTKSIHTLLFLFSFTILFSGCSSDSDSSSDTLTGTVATGEAGVGTLYITDANGTEINIALLAANNGQYSADVTGMTAPFILGFDSNDNGTGSIDLYSFAEAVNTIANVSQLTTLTMFLANNDTNIDTLYDDWDTTQLTAANIATAQEIVNANLATQIDAISGLSAEDYDFMTTAFTPDGTGIDGLLENISLNFDANGFTVDLAGVDSFTFDSEIDTSTITVGDTIIETGNFDATCSSGWCSTQSGTITIAGGVQTIPEIKVSGLPETEVPTTEDFTAAQQSFSSIIGSAGTVSNATYEITTNTPTKVVIEMTATGSSSTEFGSVPISYSIIITYTKAAP